MTIFVFDSLQAMKLITNEAEKVKHDLENSINAKGVQITHILGLKGNL